MTENYQDDIFVVDYIKLLKAILKKWYVVVLSGILCAALAFGYATFFMTPKYESSIKLYVNSDVTLGSISISSLNAAQSLVNTYIEFLNTNDTLDAVIEKADLKDEDGNQMTAKTLKGMISASNVSDTEIFKITVTDTDPVRSRRIASVIGSVLKDEIRTHVHVVEAVEKIETERVGEQVAPRRFKIAVIAGLIGVAVAVTIIFIQFLNDKRLTRDDILNDYNYPLLASVPNLNTKKTNYYYHSYTK